ncbi:MULTISPECIES: DNA polymerase III subunit beta [Caproicibacterium]|uniref:Beta sliding clamp n=1 Tax=Caproicibacterium argilliputei TaxID=3030016 RepID=A0AA97DCP4_9FIRM|nr:DNA polymerase III subunit beta [Caproicibacterium argilliputei]WOC33449.1 DNA polymerase III subunit beta [Caproicibacterium argilliputei]
MNITCNRTDLASAISSVQRAVSTKATIPELSGILMTAQEGTLELIGYDCETVGIKTNIQAEVQESGPACLPAKLLGEMVRKLSGDKVHIETGGKHMAVIKCGRSRFSVAGFDPNEYPAIPKIEQREVLRIPNGILKGMIRQTAFAVAQVDSKPIHTGTLFEINEGKIRLVSVDGYRIAIREENVGNDLNKTSFVVPGKSLNELSRILPDNAKPCGIVIGDRHIIFSAGQYTVFSRLLEGEFLDYRRAIPQQQGTEVEVNTLGFVDSIQRVSLMVMDRLKSPIRCSFGDDVIDLFSRTPLGQASDQLQAKIQGDNVEIGFNDRYLLDAFQNAETDEVKLGLNGPLAPMTVKPKDGNSFLFIVLPVRLKPEDRA